MLHPDASDMMRAVTFCHRDGDSPTAGWGEACAAQPGMKGPWQLLWLWKKPPLLSLAAAQERSRSFPLQPCRLGCSLAPLAWRARGLQAVIRQPQPQAMS